MHSAAPRRRLSFILACIAWFMPPIDCSADEPQRTRTAPLPPLPQSTPVQVAQRSRPTTPNERRPEVPGGPAGPATPPLGPGTAPSQPIVPPVQDPTMALPPSPPGAADRLRVPGSPPPLAPAEVTPGTLTLADFEQMSLDRNPTLAMAQSGVDVARGRAWQAGLWPNPTVGYVNEVLGTAAAPEYLGTLGEFMGARVRQEIPMANKRRISRNKYEWEAETANWHALAQHMSVLNGVRIRFFEVLAHQRILDYRRLLFKIADAGLRTTEELVNDGQANAPDLLAAQIAARQARIDLVHAENLYRRSWNGLITTVGAAELREPIRLDGPLENNAPPLDFEAELARLLELNPHVKAAQAQAKRDETTVLRERVEPIPNLIVQLDGGFSYLENGPATNIFVGAEIPIWNRNQGTLFQAQSDLSRARAEVERVALDLQNRLGDSFAHYNIALVTVDEYHDEILPRARQAYELLEESYRRQRAAWPQVLVAQRNWVELSIDYVNALFELRRREIEIRGLLQVDGLNVPQGPRELGHLNAVATPR